MWRRIVSISVLSCIAACDFNNTPESEPLRLSFTCEVPLPEFTLGEYSNPTEAQLAELCECIWQGMAPWAKEASQSMKDGTDIQGPYPTRDLNMKAYTNEFSRGLYSCGGDKL